MTTERMEELTEKAAQMHERTSVCLKPANSVSMIGRRMRLGALRTARTLVALSVFLEQFSILHIRAWLVSQ